MSGMPGRSGRKPRLVCACSVDLTDDTVARDWRGYRLGCCLDCRRKASARERAATRAKRRLNLPMLDRRARPCDCGHLATDHRERWGPCTGYPSPGSCACPEYTPKAPH